MNSTSRLIKKLRIEMLKRVSLIFGLKKTFSKSRKKTFAHNYRYMLTVLINILWKHVHAYLAIYLDYY